MLLNTPMVILLLMYFTLSLQEKFTIDSGPFGNYFMFWYSWLIGQILLVDVNVFLDGVVYFTRTQDMRLWVKGMLRRVLWFEGRTGNVKVIKLNVVCKRKQPPERDIVLTSRRCRIN